MEGESGGRGLINVQPFYLKIQLCTMCGCFIKYARAGQMKKKKRMRQSEARMKEHLIT